MPCCNVEFVSLVIYFLIPALICGLLNDALTTALKSDISANVGFLCLFDVQDSNVPIVYDPFVNDAPNTS